MNMRDLIPWGRNEQSMVPSPLRGEEMSSFLTLHREMNRLFDDMFSHFESTHPPKTAESPVVAW